MKILKKLPIDSFYIILLLVCALIFFFPFFLFGKIPIPADTIVGMYHPWRDVVWDNYTEGVPFKNYLITDPVRQQYVWRKLAIDQLKKGELPLWNPYSFSGTPLLANLQSAIFYPLNVIFFIAPFNLAWGVLVFLQPILTSLFLYYYLKLIKLSSFASFIGSITFSFSGFSIAWLEWNTIGHVILWLPLSLLSIEKILTYINDKSNIKNKKIIPWAIFFIFSLVSSFLAGHLQIFFYSFVVSMIYLVARFFMIRRDKVKTILLFAICYLIFIVLTSIQWLPTLQFLLVSARSIDQGSWMKDGWFIPWQNLIQYFAPDFFGNPATSNYWGIWNYGEFIGYIGLVPLIFAFYALVNRFDKKILFFGGLTVVSLIFSLPTILAKFPYIINVPFISTSQPTRLLSITSLSLSILAAIGADRWFKERNFKRTIYSLIFPSSVFMVVWLIVLKPGIFQIQISHEKIEISRRNLVLPTLLLFASFAYLTGPLIFKLKNKYINIYIVGLIVILLFELFRFGWKFTPFTKSGWIFPTTKMINTISKDKENWRFMAVDRRIMPPNFSVSYKIQDIGGYDPLYLATYNQLVAAWERGRPDISEAAFNRIVTPIHYESFMVDLLGVKYLMSLSPINSNKLELLTVEGMTYLYENKNVFPRAFFVDELLAVKNSQEEIEQMFRLKNELRRIAVTSENVVLTRDQVDHSDYAEILEYTNNKIVVRTKNTSERLLVLTDIYYPTWTVKIDGKKETLYRVDLIFRGVVVPAGNHVVEYINTLL